MALCYGWIDGQKGRLDDEYWLQRFGPRRPRSRWSKINTEKAAELIALDDALKTLAAIDERKARTLELRYFGGLDNAGIAEILKISEPTVVRDWRTARTWLFARLRPDGSHPDRTTI